MLLPLLLLVVFGGGADAAVVGTGRGTSRFGCWGGGKTVRCVAFFISISRSSMDCSVRDLDRTWSNASNKANNDVICGGLEDELKQLVSASGGVGTTTERTGRGPAAG